MTVDLGHEHETARRGEQPEGVARGDDLVAARLLGREVFRCPLGVEAPAEPLDRALDFRPVASGDQVDGLEVAHVPSLVLGGDGDAIPVRLDSHGAVLVRPVDG